MIISLDYDDTYTKDPEFWTSFISMVKDFGHTVICCTLRSESEWDGNLSIPVYCTNGMCKRDFLVYKGIKVDIWIDDMPEGIIHNLILDFNK